MMRHGARARTSAALAVALVALPGGTVPGHDAAAHAAQVPQLAISISDGQVAARTGQTLTYTIRLRNTGPVAVAGLQVTQIVPVGLVASSASDGGARSAGRVTWSTGVPAGGTRTFRVTARVMLTPARELRLAAVACAALRGGQPIVCAAHLDRLPATAPGPAPRAWAGLLLPAATGLCLLAGCLVALLLGMRGWPRRRPPSRPGRGKTRGRHATASGHPAEPGSEPENNPTLPAGT